ncbi:J domain-containing protein, partial [Cronobacter sakazakii]
MRALEILGLEPGADERAIKRAYARLLKGCRPDDDPQGFQQLRDAYEAALDQARRGVADDDDEYNEDDACDDANDEHDDDSEADARRQADDPPLAKPQREPEPAPPENEPVRPAPLYEPPRTAALLDGLNEENLNARWLEARAMGEPREFEEAVLTRCLWHLAPDEYAFVAQAQACFEWLTPGQRVVTDESQQNRLRHVLLTPYAEEMRAALEEGNDARYLACLR